MRDSQPDLPFLQALLAQDRDVSAAQYAAYRRDLERKIADEALRQRSRRRRRIGAALFLAAAAAVASILVLRLRPAGPPAKTPSNTVRPELVLLRPATPQFVCAPALPFALEESADVIAVAALGEPWTQQGEQFLRLDVQRYLKGEPGAAFACGLPREAAPAGAERKGDRVLLYLQGSKQDGWSLVDIQPLGPQPLGPVGEGHKLAEIERFLDVRRAAASPDPRAEYDRCLAPARGGVDGPALSALCMKPDPQAADALLENLTRLREALRQGAALKPGQAQAAREKLLVELAQLLGRLREPRAVADVLACTPHLSTPNRAKVFELLPSLCAAADPKVTKEARAVLVAALREAPRAGGDYASALAALGKLADAAALEVLQREQARRPYGVANGRALAAVREAARAFGGDARARAHEAWLKLLSAYAPPEQPTAGERQFIRAVIGALAAAELSPAARQQLHTLLNRRTAPWFGEELRRLADR
jgi:hypothetical protein